MPLFYHFFLCLYTVRWFLNTLRFWDGMYQEWLEDPESFAERYLPSNNAADNTPTDFQEPRDDSLPF